MNPSPAVPRKPSSGIVVPHAPTTAQRLVAFAFGVVSRLLMATVRYRTDALPIPDEPAIFALWHNRLAVCLGLYRRYLRPRRGRDCLAALVSASKDGALLAAALENFGIRPVRGSSSRRGGQALVELVSCLQQGYDAAVTPDGPRGPCYSVQEGALMLAQLTGAPVIPVHCRLGWKIRVKSWDRFQIPLPFTVCELSLGAPLRVPRDATPELRAQFRQQLETALRAGVQND